MPTDAETSARRIERRVLRFIREHQLLSGGERVLLAVSGGADSLALLGIMARLAEPLGVTVLATYVNHRIRSEAEVAADIETVTGIAAALGVPFEPCTVGGPVLHRDRSPEDAARVARYRALLVEAGRVDAAVIATGHTKSDQAETVLLRLLRGSGLRGLSAIAPVAPWPVAPGPDLSTVTHPALLRPLLGLSREETASYCRLCGFEPRHDRENDNPRYLRNRLRHDIMPRLRELNPAFEDALARLADEARGHRAELEIDRLAPAPRSPWDGRPVVLDRRVLRSLAAPARLAVLRSALGSVLPERAAPSRAHLEALNHLVSLDRAAETHLPRGLRAWTEGVLLTIGRARLPRSLLPDVTVPVPGTVQLARWRVEAETGRWNEEPRCRGWTMVLNEDVTDGLTVGPRRSGDKIDVGTGHRRVQDELVDAKIPRWERDQIPVFRTPQGVVWVAGVRAASWAIRSAPGSCVRLTVEPVGNSEWPLPSAGQL